MPFWVASIWSLTRTRSPARGQRRIYPRENGGAGVSLRKARAQEAAHSGRRNQGLTIVHTERADRQRRHTVPRVWRIRRRRRKEAPGQPLFERPWGIVAGSRMELSIPQIAELAMRSSVTALPPANSCEVVKRGTVLASTASDNRAQKTRCSISIPACEVGTYDFA